MLTLHSESLYSPFARVLADLYNVVEAIDCHIPKDVHDAEDGADRTQPLTYRESFYRDHNPGSRSASASGSSRKQRSRCHGSGEGSGKALRSPGIAIKQHDGSKKQLRKMDCPIYKHWDFYLRDRFPPPCNGCSERFMSQIRNHIKRAHVAQEGSQLAFYHHCVRCKENFVDAHAWTEHVSYDSCTHIGESKGNPAIPWAKLYLKLHPGMTEIPSPCKFLVSDSARDVANVGRYR